MRGKTNISIFNFIHHFFSLSLQNRSLRNKNRLIYRRTTVSCKTHADIKPVKDFYIMTEVEIKILEIFQFYLVEIKNTIRSRLYIIQHITAVNTVSVTECHVQGSTFLRPVIEIGIYTPIKLFTREVISDFRNYTQ